MNEIAWHLSVCKLNQRADLDMFCMWAVWFGKPPTRKEWRAPDVWGACRATRGDEDAIRQARRAWLSFRELDSSDVLADAHQEIEPKWAAAHLRTVQGKRTWPAARTPRPKPAQGTGPRVQTGSNSERVWTGSCADFDDMFRRWYRENPVTLPCFELLGVSRPYTEEKVRAAYRALAFKHHPDRGGSAEKFREVTRARDEALRHCGVTV